MLTTFGKWEIDQEFGLIGRVYPNREDGYNINKERLWEYGEYNGQKVWNWLIHLAKKRWTTPDNFNDLVAAFLFAQDLFKRDKPHSTSLDEVSTAQSIYIAQQLVNVLASEEVNESEGGYITVDLDSMDQYIEKLNSIQVIDFSKA